MNATVPVTPYDNDSRVSNVIAMVAGTLAIATLTTVARLYTRFAIVKKVGIDDCFAVLSLLCTIGCGVPIALNTQNGIGKHIWTVDMTRFPTYLKIFYVSIVMYGAAITMIKATFLLQYQRIFAVSGYVNRFLFALIVVMFWSIASLLVAIFSCNPVSGFWDQSVPAYCIPEHPWWEINSAGNIITDFAVFCLPLPTLWKLRQPRSQKIALLGIFSLGFFTCILSIVRIFFLHIQDDLTWGNVDSATWSMIELVSGITCANLATLRPLLKRFIPSIGGSQPSAPKASGDMASGPTPVGRASAGRGWSGHDASSRSNKSTTGSANEEVELRIHGKTSQDSILR